MLIGVMKNNDQSFNEYFNEYQNQKIVTIFLQMTHLKQLLANTLMPDIRVLHK